MYGKQDQEIHKKKKINFFGMFFLVLVTIASVYANFKPISEYKKISEELAFTETSIEDVDAEMKKHPMYHRLNEYGRGVSALDNLISYKGLSPEWHLFIPEIASILPNNVTVNEFKYDANKNLTFKIIAPSKDRLIEALNLLQDSNIIEKVNFTAMDEQKISTPGERTQSYWYAIDNLTAVISTKYLQDKYNFSKQIREATVAEMLKASKTSQKSNKSNTWTLASGTGAIWQNDVKASSGSTTNP